MTFYLMTRMTSRKQHIKMPCMNVKEETGELLHLEMVPSARSWSLFGAVIALGFGSAYYASQPFMWSMACISLAVFFALTILDDWEEGIFDKKNGEVTLIKTTLLQKLFSTEQGQKKYCGLLSDITDIKLEEETMKYGNNAYRIALKFGGGYSINLTDTATVDDKVEHELVANKIQSFLDLSNAAAQDFADPNLGDNVDDIIDESDSTASSTDDGFVQVGHDDFAHTEDSDRLTDNGPD